MLTYKANLFKNLKKCKEKPLNYKSILIKLEKRKLS